MGLSHLSFLRDWKNPADFPTVEPDEATVRADLQYHPDAIKDYINETLIPSHDSLTYAKHSHNNKTVLDGITADDVAKWRGTIGTFRINVTYSGGVYSADKTFDEIKAAYDAGQQPFVVLTGGTFDLVYTLASFEAPTDGSEPKFVDFERYLVGDGILETDTLRIYSYITDNGSNVVARTDVFKMPPATTEKLGVVRIGENLKITDAGVLSVDAAGAVEQGNMRPITSAAVYVEIGNINALLETI